MRNMDALIRTFLSMNILYLLKEITGEMKDGGRGQHNHLKKSACNN